MCVSGVGCVGCVEGVVVCFFFVCSFVCFNEHVGEKQCMFLV